MSRSPPPTSERSAMNSRLQRALASAPMALAAVGGGELLAWLGQPLDLQSASDFADAFAARADLCPDMQGTPSGSRAPDSSGTGGAYEELLLATRGRVLAELARSFAAFEGSVEEVLIPLPRFDLPSGLDGLTGAERLRRFYSAWQREMELRVQALRRSLRDSLRGMSAELAGLAALDEAFERHVLRAGEGALASLPLLMLPRWEALLGTDAFAENSALLVAELKELLLAELEQRLQPVLGLVEACVAHRERD